MRVLLPPPAGVSVELAAEHLAEYCLSYRGGMRVLVTGSRNWEDPAPIHLLLDTVRSCTPANSPVTVVHGDCPDGADRIASAWCAKYRSKNHIGAGVIEERHPANWSLYGKAAGPRRNTEMAALGGAACLAFIRDGSRGATGCAGLAEGAGIPAYRVMA